MGISIRNGAELAYQDWLATGSAIAVEVIYHETLLLRSVDSWENSMELERDSAERAAQDAQTVVYLGPMMSEQAKISLPILNRAGIAQISTTTTWPGLTEAGFGPGEPGIYYPTGRSHFFRLVPHDGHQAAAAARWCAQLGFQRIFLVHSTGLFSLGYAGIFAESASDANLDLVGRQSWRPHGGTKADLAALVAQIVEAAPDTVYLVDNNGWLTSELIKELAVRSPDIAMMAPDYLMRLAYSNKLSASQDQRLFSTSSVPPDHQRWSSPESQRFRQDYVARFGVEPDAESARSYEAMRLSLKAIESAGDLTRDGVRDALRELGPVESILGELSFDSAGDLEQAKVYGYRLVGDQWRYEVTL